MELEVSERHCQRGAAAADLPGFLVIFPPPSGHQSGHPGLGHPPAPAAFLPSPQPQSPTGSVGERQVQIGISSAM